MPEQTPIIVEAFQALAGQFDLWGEVRDENGSPLADLDLLVKSLEDGREITTKTDDQGRFLVENVKAGKYTVEVRSDQYHSQKEHEITRD